MFNHLRQYLNEIRVSLRLGAGWKDRFALVIAGLEFHLSNLFSLPPKTTASSYRIRLTDGTRDIRLRRRTGDFFIFHELFTNRYYDLPDSLVPAAPEVIVDLGANIGLATLVLADRFPGARHVCVEPNPGNLPLLRANLSFLGDRVAILEGAASHRSGEARFFDSDWTGGGRLVADGPSSRSVRCLTLAEIMSAYRIDAIDILKINIEGAEEGMFSLAPGWLSKVGCILIELHNGYSLHEFRADVASSGFRVFEPGSDLENGIVIAVRAGSVHTGAVQSTAVRPGARAQGCSDRLPLTSGRDAWTTGPG
jgi:FkbM family methyltransferase